MIELIRIKSFLKIKEFRYPEKLIIDNSFDIIKIYSFKNLDKKGWLKESHCTMMVNLLKSNDLLFKDMNKNYQKHIRREEREEIEVSLTNKEEDFLSFYNGVYLNLCRDKKLKKYPLEFLKQGDLWLARKDGKILSGVVIFNDQDYASQSFAASEHIEYNGSRLLIWEAIKYYKLKGLKWFNFGGGESDYKRRFGSERTEVWLYINYCSLKAKRLNWLRNKILFR